MPFIRGGARVKKNKVMFSVLLASFSDMLVPKFDDLRICQFREGNRDSTVSGTLFFFF